LFSANLKPLSRSKLRSYVKIYLMSLELGLAGRNCHGQKAGKVTARSALVHPCDPEDWYIPLWQTWKGRQFRSWVPWLAGLLRPAASRWR